MSGIDLGLAGKTALVCGSSDGLGYACAAYLAQAGANVILNGRNEAKLAAAAERIWQEFGSSPMSVAADVTTAEGRQRALELCPQPDILVNNAAGPPIGDFRSFDENSWAEAARVYDEAIARAGRPIAADWSLFYARGIALERSGRRQVLRPKHRVHRAVTGLAHDAIAGGHRLGEAFEQSCAVHRSKLRAARPLE